MLGNHLNYHGFSPSIIVVTSHQIPQDEIEIKAIRAQGPGGQNVNKVSSAIHLRFDIEASSLPDDLKQTLLRIKDKRLTSEGQIVIKAQKFRTQEKNRDDAIQRLHELVNRAADKPKPRKTTKPTLAAKRKRLDAKNQRSKTKKLRNPVRDF